MYNNQSLYCPNCMYQNTCPFFSSQMRTFDDYDDYDDYDEYYELDDLDLDYRAPQQQVNRILDLMRQRQPQLFRSFTRYGVPRRQVDNYFRIAINYTLNNASRYKGNINRRTNAIFNDFRRVHGYIFSALRRAGVPTNVINSTFRDVIEFTLRNSTPSPVPPPRPPHVPGGR